MSETKRAGWCPYLGRECDYFIAMPDWGFECVYPDSHKGKTCKYDVDSIHEKEKKL